MKFSEKVRIPGMILLLLSAEALNAHPFDQVRADSSAYFTVNGDKVRLKLKFPVHSYVNLYVNSPDEYDAYLKKMNSEAEKKKIREYAKAHVMVFDGKKPAPLTVTRLEYEEDPYLSDGGPQFILIEGEYRAGAKIKDLYIFNELFKEGKVAHFGASQVEIGEQIFDFEFRKNKFFRYEVK